MYDKVEEKRLKTELKSTCFANTLKLKQDSHDSNEEKEQYKV
jgi:hypothetical protein